jgi:hypothetical protein
MKGMHLWVLESTVEVHWPLNALSGSLPPPLLMVLAQASTLALRERVSEPLFWLGRVATTLCTVEGSGEPTPSVLAWMSCSTWKLTRVPSEPLVCPPFTCIRLPALHFPGHPQPWSLRGCVGYFELAAPPWFGCPFPAQKAQSVGPGCLGWTSQLQALLWYFGVWTRNFWSWLRKLLGCFWEFSLCFLWGIELHRL